MLWVALFLTRTTAASMHVEKNEHSLSTCISIPVTVAFAGTEKPKSVTLRKFDVAPLKRDTVVVLSSDKSAS